MTRERVESSLSCGSCYYGRYNSHQAYEQIDYFNYYMRQEPCRAATAAAAVERKQPIAFAVFLILITGYRVGEAQVVGGGGARVITASIASQVTTRSWPSHGLLKCPIEHATRVAL